MNLLQNELIRKYFGEERPGAVISIDGDPKHFDYEGWMAKRILTAMQQPITEKEQTRYLEISSNNVVEKQWFVGGNYEGLHPYMLRLPDSFQTKKCHVHQWTITSCECGETHFPPKPTNPQLGKSGQIGMCPACDASYLSDIHALKCLKIQRPVQSCKAQDRAAALNDTARKHNGLKVLSF